MFPSLLAPLPVLPSNMATISVYSAVTNHAAGLPQTALGPGVSPNLMCADYRRYLCQMPVKAPNCVTSELKKSRNHKHIPKVKKKKLFTDST